MTAWTEPAVQVQLQVVIGGVGVPIELGSVDVHIGSSRDELAGFLRAVADEVENGAAFRQRYVLGPGQVGPDEGAGRAVPPVAHDRDGPPGSGTVQP
jgi:hypothetical protein